MFLTVLFHSMTKKGGYLCKTGIWQQRYCLKKDKTPFEDISAISTILQQPKLLTNYP